MTQSNVPTLATAQLGAARLGVFVQVFAVWQFRRRSRNTLARLAPHQLRDIGLDPLSAEAEAAKPFWKD